MCLTLIASSVIASCLYCVPYHSSVRSVCPSNDLETTATLKEKKKKPKELKDHCTRQHDTVHFSQLPWGKWAMQLCFYQISASVNRLGIMVITSIKGSSFPELLNLLCRALDQCTIYGQFRPSTINRELLEQWRAILDFPASINYIRAQNRFRLKTWTLFPEVVADHSPTTWCLVHKKRASAFSIWHL